MRDAKVETLWGRDGTPYLSRVMLGRLRFHLFHRGDADADCHDHPADFLTFPLVSYVEEVSEPHAFREDERVKRFRVVRAFRFHRRRAEYAHRVLGRWTGESFMGEPFTLWDSGQVATIVWWGRKRREWGFWTSRGWVPWAEYVA